MYLSALWLTAGSRYTKQPDALQGKDEHRETWHLLQIDAYSRKLKKETSDAAQKSTAI